MKKLRTPSSGVRALAAALFPLLAAPLAALAQFTTPHVSNVAGDVTNVLGGATFINHGLVGVGHVSASALDSFGETFGSVSSLQVTGWKANGDGSFSGTFNILPDRGYNSGNFYSDYAARINTVGFTFTPYYGTANIGGTTDLEKLNAQTNQFAFGAISGVKFTYFDSNTGSNSFTTGLDPGSNYATVFGKPMPYVGTYVGQATPADSTLVVYSNINKLPLDSEALVLKADGSGYVGDEYGAHVYYFNPAKQILDAIVPPPAFQPHSPTNVLNYSSVNPPMDGRRNNQGFEGVSLSPDGSRLFALLQTACVQDGTQAANDNKANYTRLLIYDVSANPVPTAPISEYVLPLPTYRSDGSGKAVNKTCAQSEIVALDNQRFLVLPRDGNGLGNSANNPNVYKCALLVDTAVGNPVNIASDARRNVEGGRVTTAPGALDPAITPLSWIEAVNLLNTNQLAKFNVQYDTGTNQVSKLTMGEKWEGMTLVSANDPANPDDYFLFVGNDNDFLTSDGHIRGPDGSIVSYNGFAGYPANRIPAPLDSANNENDTRILAFRVTIATASAPAKIVRSASFDPASAPSGLLPLGGYVLTAQDTNGNWVNAVDLNNGGGSQFVFGPFQSSDALGTYGVDTNNNTVWAVVDYDAAFAPATVARRSAQSLASLRIVTMSDIHVFATNLLVSNGSAFQTYLAQDRKLLAESAAIFTAAVDDVIAQQPDIVLVTGDLTKDGEYESHLVVSNQLARLAAAGAKVYVIPGNHDINNANAMVFDGANAYPATNITPQQFQAIYAPFGYNQALARDTNSVAYVVEPVSGLRILAMDPCQYSTEPDHTAGSFPPARLGWITNQLKQAQADGKVVLGMMHHNALEHFPGQATLFPEYVVSNHAAVAALFSSLGLKTVFTGHFHAEDVAGATFNGNNFYDIETGSTVTYPCPYRVMELETNGQLAINTRHILSINYDLGAAPDFQTYAYGFLTNGMSGLSQAMLQMAPFNLDAATAAYLAPAVTEAMIDHYVGDEPGLAGASASTRAIVTSLLGGGAQQKQLGQAIYSILTDPAPADNNVTLSLSAPTLSGPANGALISNGPAVLSWAPVYGASVYRVTIVSGSFTQTYDATGNSLALPANLPNGVYTWTVTPDNGAASVAGTFTLDLPPTLVVAPSTNGFIWVYWPVSATSEYQLQFSPDVAGTNWVNVTSNGFFRLIKP